MKKFIAIFSILLFLSFNMNVITAIANPEPISLVQGLYSVKETGLSTGSAYNIRNTSPNGRAVVIIFDPNQMMQEFIRLEPNSPYYIVKPLDFGYIIIIIGGGKVEFT